MQWDIFISHASEDKEAVARPLATLLQDAGKHVWLDANTLTLGDSLSQKIDHGLANSRYGVIILSKNFFAKGWPQRELNGLVQREMQGRKVILPVWHGIDHEYVMQFSPTLADKLAITTNNGLAPVSDAILQVLLNDNTQTKPTPTNVPPANTARLQKRRTTLISITVLILLLGMLLASMFLRPSLRRPPGQQAIEAGKDQAANDQQHQPPPTTSTPPATEKTPVPIPDKPPQGPPAKIQPDTQIPNGTFPLPPAADRPSQCHIAAVTFTPASFGRGTLTAQFTAPLANTTGDALTPDRINTTIDGSTGFITCQSPRVTNAFSITQECATTSAPSSLGDNLAVCFNNISLQVPHLGTLTQSVCGSTSTDWGPFGKGPNDSQAVLLVRLNESFRSECDEAYNLCIATKTVDGQEREDCQDFYNTPGLIHRRLATPSAHTYVRLRKKSTGTLFINQEVFPQVGKTVTVTLKAP